jgi:hypothetical protein
VPQRIRHALPGWEGGGAGPLKPLEALNTTPQSHEPWNAGKAKQGGGCLAVNAIAGAARCSVAHQSDAPGDPQQPEFAVVKKNGPRMGLRTRG